MSIEKGEPRMAGMQQCRVSHTERERTHGNPASRVVVLVGHGGVRRDFVEHLRRFESGERHV